MGRNIEIKARVRDTISMRARIARVCDAPPVILRQEDTFFHCAKGRLKLRRTAPDAGEIIFYERDDKPGPKLSQYVRSPSSDPSSAKVLLGHAYGVLGVVRKTRALYLAGRTRIHLDEVEDLGDFVELEVVLSDSEPVGDGERVAEELMGELGIERSDRVEDAYIDMILRRR